MVAAFQRHEARTFDTSREPAPFIERLDGVVAAMQNQCRDIHLRQQIGNVDLVDGLTDARGSCPARS